MVKAVVSLEFLALLLAVHILSWKIEAKRGSIWYQGDSVAPFNFKFWLTPSAAFYVSSSRLEIVNVSLKKIAGFPRIEDTLQIPKQSNKNILTLKINLRT